MLMECQELQKAVRLVVIIPLYRSPELIAPLYDGLIAAASDLRRANAKVILINDSPDDVELQEQLRIHGNRLDDVCLHETIVNTHNLGFIKSSNIGLKVAHDLKCDALLLNSDAILTASALGEMQKVAASDPMIAFVSPRSNNATICNSPYPEIFRKLPLDQAEFAHRAIENYLNDVTYVPTVVGFCLYIKSIVIKEFGILSEIFEQGYNEENDLILRANKAGFRAALANKAFVPHIGSVSFETKELKRNFRELRNRIELDRAHPEYTRSIRRYFASSEYRAQELISALSVQPHEKIIINFDCNNVGPYYNGTINHSLELIKAFSRLYRDRYEIQISCSAEATEFHRLADIDGVATIQGQRVDGRTAAINFRIGQPFDWAQLIEMTRTAPICGYLMLDTIALDCLHLDQQDLQKIWRQMLNLTNFVVFNSGFSREQFIRRFGADDRHRYFVSLCATDVEDDSSDKVEHCEKSSAKYQKPYILVVGNDYPHKNLDSTIDLISKQGGNIKYVVLGRELNDDGHMVGLPSGLLTDEEVDSLYQNADALLFPSFYEGFGLPIVTSLNAKVPVIARNIPAFEEIKMNSKGGNNLHLFDTTEEMVEFAAQLPDWQAAAYGKGAIHTWSDAARQLNDAFEFGLRTLHESDLCHRLSINDALEMARVNFQSAAVASGLDRAPELTDELKAIVSSISNRGRSSDISSEDRAKYFELHPNEVVRHLGSCVQLRDLSVKGTISRLSDREIVHTLLDANSCLCDRGRLVLNVKSKSLRDTFLRVAPYDLDKLTMLPATAGFFLVEKIAVRNGVAGRFEKEFSWWNKKYLEGDNHKFIDDIYRRAFNRPADPASQTHVDRLNEGESRYSVAKRLFASRERLSLLQEQCAARGLFSADETALQS